MKRQGGGRIINIGSISAQMPRMHSVPYTTTKHGLTGLTKAAALEGREFGVVVSCLHPGNVATERRQASKLKQDEEPMMTPDELAAAAVTMAGGIGAITAALSKKRQAPSSVARLSVGANLRASRTAPAA